MTANTIDHVRKTKAAQRIAKTLTPAENGIDASLVASATLIASIAQARLDTEVPAETIHEALMSAAAGLSKLADARHDVIACHRHLAKTRDVYGLDESQVGCTLGKGGGSTAFVGMPAIAA